MPTIPSGVPAPPLVVFADLDGTVLRHEDYDWSAARPAITELARRAVPLVIASSKTRAEIELWRDRLANRDPFISENGGGLYVPPGTTPRPVPGAFPAGPYECVAFGRPYAELRAALPVLAGRLGVPLAGFGDMGAEQIARLTGLAGDDLRRAREREYDEPFVPARELGDEEEGALIAHARALGLRVTRGGRFHHLLGPTSKGTAARRLMAGYGGRSIPSLGIGDGPNDLDLLRAVDRAFVVARFDGTHHPELRAALPGARFTRGIGPEGFAEAIFSHFERSSR